MKSVKIPWYQKPILHNNKYINVQRGAMLAAIFSLVSIFWNIFIRISKFSWLNRRTYIIVILCFPYNINNRLKVIIDV